MASTEIKNIDSHSHAGLHRSSIRFSPARQYLFFPRTVRGTNCSCIPRLILPLSLSLSLSLSLVAQESQTQRLFFIWFFLPLAPTPTILHTHTHVQAVPLTYGGSRPIPRHPTSSHTTSPRESTILFLFHFSFFPSCACLCMFARHRSSGERVTRPNVWSRNGIYIID